MLNLLHAVNIIYTHVRVTLLFIPISCSLIIGIKNKVSEVMYLLHTFSPFYVCNNSICLIKQKKCIIIKSKYKGDNHVK